MSTDASPLAGSPGGDALAKVTSQWDDLQPTLPKSVDGSHLAPCPHCGVENGALAQLCWNCEGSLTPATPLRLVTKDGAEVASRGLSGGGEPDVSATSDPNKPPAGSGHNIRRSPDVSAVQAEADASSLMPEWTSALDQGIAADAPPPTVTRGLDLRLIGAVFTAALIAGAWGYYKAHTANMAASAAQFGAAHTARPSTDPGAWGDDATANLTRRGPGPNTGAAADTVTHTVDDALAAAERALSSATATAAAPVIPDDAIQTKAADGAEVNVVPSGTSNKKRREA